MKRKIVLGIMLTLLLISMLTPAFNIQQVKASGTIYIRADGSVDPPTANITTVDNITYTFTDNNYDSIVVERDNIVVDGAGYIVQGTGGGIGVSLWGRSNVTIKNMEINTFEWGIWVVYDSFYNTLSNNDIHCARGIWFMMSGNNTFADNNVYSNNYYGIGLNSSYYNTLTGNNVSNSQFGIFLSVSSYNNIFHNNFINNTHQVDILDSTNTWDDGYPSGGNYWSDYAGLDLYGGSYQNETGSDGIGDTPYVIDGNNQDNYPLVTPWGALEPIKIGVLGPMAWMQGQGIKEGAILAAEEINATGGILGHPVEIITADTLRGQQEPNATTGTAAMEELMAAGVDFVVGGFRSEAVFGAREVAMDYQKIYLIAGAATSELVDCHDWYDPDGPLEPTPPGPCDACVRCNYTRYKYLFRVLPANSTTLVWSLWAFHRFVLEQKLLPLYGKLLWEDAPNPQVKIAVITENSTWADRLHLYYTDPALYPLPNHLGPYANVTYVARPSANETNFGTILQSIKDSGARLIIHTFAEEAGRQFITQWKDMEIQAVPVGINVYSQESDMWNLTGGNCEYETILAGLGTKTPVIPYLVPFWEAYEARWGHPPIYTSYGSYESVYILKETIDAAGKWPMTADEMVPLIEQTDRTGILGKIKFTGPHPMGPSAYDTYMANATHSYLDLNPTMKGTLHEIFCNEIGPTWTQGYARPFIVQWQAGKLEVIWPADQSYSKELALPSWMEPIKIGVVGPMDFIQGQGMWEGAVLAAEKINATGGILGHPIELHQGMEYVYPADPAKSAAEVERLITEAGVDFIIGGSNSVNAFAMREVAMDHRKIFFLLGPSYNELVDCGNGYDPDGPLGPTPPGPCDACVRCNYTRYKYLFRSGIVNGTTIFLSLTGFYRFVLEEKLLPIYGELLWEGASNPQVKVAVIAENETWADRLYLYLTHPAVYPHPIVLGPYANVTYSSRVRWNATDFTEELTAIRDSGARLIIHIFSEIGGINFIEQWRDMNIEAVPVGINVVSQTDEMWNSTSGKCEYETFLASSGTNTSITGLSTTFWSAYVNRWGHDPVSNAWGAYEAIIGLDEMFEANFASMPDLSNQTVYDNLIPLIEQTDRLGTLGRFKYTGPNPNLNSTNYPFYSTNPNFTGTLHDFFSNEIGPTWTQGYARPFIVQWQAGKLEVIWPADQSYSKEFELPHARVSVVPSTDVAVAGQSFTVNITVSNAVDLYLWAFSISWNPATLDLIDVTEGDFLTQGGSTTGVLIKEINQTGGYMREAACSLLGTIPGVNGSGTLATLTFKATAVGSSPLEIYFCDLLNSTGESISRLVTDSAVDIDAPELSISSVSLPYPDLSLYVNTTVSVNVTIQNTGNFSAGAFNVSLTAYWNEGEIVDYFGKSTVESLEANTTLTLQFTFTLQYIGNYTLTFNVDCDNDVIEVNETNNELILMIKVKMQGDIDGDDEVTYLDLFDLSRAYWSTPEDTNWNPYADINNDGRVDYNDLFLLAQNYSLA